jgi:hypothetical protein
MHSYWRLNLLVYPIYLFKSSFTISSHANFGITLSLFLLQSRLRIHYVLASLKLSAGNVQTISILYWISFLFNWRYPYWIMYIIILDSRSLLVWLPIEHNIHISITLIHWICHQSVDQYSAPYNLAGLILVLQNLFFNLRGTAPSYHREH